MQPGGVRGCGADRLGPGGWPLTGRDRASREAASGGRDPGPVAGVRTADRLRWLVRARAPGCYACSRCGRLLPLTGVCQFSASRERRAGWGQMALRVLPELLADAEHSVVLEKLTWEIFRSKKTSGLPRQPVYAVRRPSEVSGFRKLFVCLRFFLFYVAHAQLPDPSATLPVELLKKPRP